MFGREFYLPQAMLLWDAIFADSADLDLLDYICVTMLCYLRDFCSFKYIYTCR